MDMKRRNALHFLYLHIGIMENHVCFFGKDHDLRRYAANDKIFKLFFLHPFLASTIYNNTIKNKFDIG